MPSGLRLTAPQRAALRAALREGEAAHAAWQSEQSAIDFERDDADPAAVTILPLVYLSLAKTGRDFPHAERLKHHYTEAWHRSALTLDAAPAAVHALHQAGLPFVVMNAAAALRVQEDGSSRPLLALDLWMPAGQVPRAEATLGTLKWRLTDGRGSATLGFQTQAGARLRLITRPFPGPNKPTANAMQLAAVPLTLGGVLTSGIAPHDFVVYAAYRAVYGQPARRLARLASIAHTFHQHSLSAFQLGLRAREMGVVVASRRALATLAEHAPAPLVKQACAALMNTRPTLRERLREATHLHPALRQWVLRARELGGPRRRR